MNIIKEADKKQEKFNELKALEKQRLLPIPDEYLNSEEKQIS